MFHCLVEISDISGLHHFLSTTKLRTSPFVYLEAAATDAYELIQEFEFGRLDGRAIAAGKLHVSNVGHQMWQDRVRMNRSCLVETAGVR